MDRRRLGVGRKESDVEIQRKSGKRGRIGYKKM